MNKKLGNLIISACNDIINLKLIKEFLLVWQTGSGTQTNKNANEVISNYIIKKLKMKIGGKNPVHPNDHVNLSQSSNDTFPTIMHVAVNELTTEKLLPNLKDLIKEFSKKQKKFQTLIKIGRTHTQDATPITLGNEFSAFLQSITKLFEKIKNFTIGIEFLAQGGTAVDLESTLQKI